MCLQGSYKKNKNKKYFFAFLKSLKEGDGSGSISQRCGFSCSYPLLGGRLLL
jgi:hypothetical protein